MIEHLSKRLQNYAKPLEGDQIVIFKLVAAGKKDETRTDQFGNQIETKPSRSISERCRINDPGDPEISQKILEHVTGKRPVKNPDGTTRYDNIVEKVFFKEGIVTCTKNNNHTYQYLMLRPDNGDNPFRPKGKVKVVFERIDHSKKVKAELRDKDTLYGAIDLIKYADKDDIRQLARNLPDGFKINMDNPIDTMKLDLINIAEKSPRTIISASKKAPIKIKLQMKDAESYQLISFNEVTRAWIDTENNEICNIEPGIDRYDGLVDFLNDNPENKKIYQAIIKELKQIEQGALV